MLAKMMRFSNLQFSYSIDNDSLLRRSSDFISVFSSLVLVSHNSVHLLSHICCALIVFPFAEKKNESSTVLFILMSRFYNKQPWSIWPNKLAGVMRSHSFFWVWRKKKNIGESATNCQFSCEFGLKRDGGDTAPLHSDTAGRWLGWKEKI